MAENGFLNQTPGFATTAIHAGQNPDKWKSACVVPPIVTSTSFKQTAPNEHFGFSYGRSGNPTRNSLEECLAAIEGAKYATTFASGVGAITTIVSLLNKGDHILSCDDIYGGTSLIFRSIIERLGIETTIADFTDIQNVKEAIKENTKMVWFETPTNPLLKVVDIAEVRRVVKAHSDDILIVMDNTFMTPYLQRPLDFGADITLYSLSKYMNGHTDVIMGAAVVNSAELNNKLKFLQNVALSIMYVPLLAKAHVFLTTIDTANLPRFICGTIMKSLSAQDAMGIIPSPFDCYLVNRGLKTLALRMERHKSSSLAIAKWLQKHPKIISVSHPGLLNHPQYEIAKRQTSGHSGMLSFKHCGGLAESKKILKALKLIYLADSLGGYESLAELPILMSHETVPQQQRQKIGITDALIRVSIGLEDTEDLIKDFDQALKTAFNKT